MKQEGFIFAAVVEGVSQGGPLSLSWHQVLGSFCQEASRVCMIPLDSSTESLSPGLPLDNSTQPHSCNLRWVCEHSAVATTLPSCPEMAFGPLGVALTPKPLPKALVQISSLWHQ